MAAGKAPERQPAAPQRPMLFDGLLAIVRAGRGIPTRGHEERRNSSPINKDCADRQCFHQCPLISSVVRRRGLPLKPATAQKLLHCGPHFRKRGLGYLHPGGEHCVPPVTDGFLPDYLLQPPLDPVSHHRLAYSTADNEPEPALLEFVGECTHYEQRMKPGSAFTPDRLVLTFAGEAPLSLHKPRCPVARQ